MRVIGKSIPRADTVDKVTGAAKYAGDFALPGMLHLQIVGSTKPHAKIMAIHVEKARQFAGVIAVLTSEDVPNNRCGIIKKDREVLCSKVVRCIGDPIAVVVAETEEQAKAAARKVEIIYEELPVMGNPIDALASDAYPIHADTPNNILFSQQISRGDVEKAFAEADVVVEREYHTPMQEHAYLETEAGISYIDDEDILTVICSGQSVHDDQFQIAEALGLSLDRVRVKYPAIGGAFGGKEEVSIQIILALAAFKLWRPVKIAWSRKESILGHSKRHAMTLRYTWAARKSGQITAAKMVVVADAGAYDHGSITVLKNYIFGAAGPYEIPNIQLQTKAVYTNNVPGGAFRGYGFPQIAFASELQVAALSNELGIDPVTMRLNNCYREGSRFPAGGEVPTGVNLPALIKESAKGIGLVEKDGMWKKPGVQSGSPHKKRGIGIAAGMKNSGFGLGFPEGSEARVLLEGESEIERVIVQTAAADVGQGVHSAMRQIAAEVLNVPIKIVQMVTSDTQMIGDSGPASASRLTLFAGNAVKFAAEIALKEWENEERPARGHYRWEAPPTFGTDPGLSGGSPVHSMTYGAQAVEVEVDALTGQIKIIKVVSAHDPGKMVNPMQVVGQIEGGVVQAVGWTLLEDFKAANGVVLTDQLSTYLIPTSMDIPGQIVSIIEEKADPLGPFGVRGIGEIPFIPLAPAIIAAIHDAVGVWCSEIPMTAEKMLLFSKKK